MSFSAVYIIPKIAAEEPIQPLLTGVTQLLVSYLNQAGIYTNINTDTDVRIFTSPVALDPPAPLYDILFVKIMDGYEMDDRTFIIHSMDIDTLMQDKGTGVGIIWSVLEYLSDSSGVPVDRTPLPAVLHQLNHPDYPTIAMFAVHVRPTGGSHLSTVISDEHRSQLKAIH